MAFYELVYLMRQDTSSTDVDKFVEDFTKIASEHDSNIIKNEYWGFRSLAYPILNNKKAHYIFLCIQGNNKFLEEIDRRTKLNENIIRSSVVKVDAIDMGASTILKNKNGENEEVINVTVNKEVS